MDSSSSDVTRLLMIASEGDEEALNQVLPLVYDQLHALADGYLRQEQAGHTLQPTALVNEAYLKLIDQKRTQWESRNHFLAVAAISMRRILVNHAKHKKRLKRGGDRKRQALSDSIVLGQEPDIDLIALDEALHGLAKIDARKVRIVEMRFFVGLTVEQTAEALDVSQATIKRDWEFAKTWLLREIRDPECQ
ncbi:MAG: sigma-70 family RNA polymerase sigma factor [Planctomycetota bacterium]|nr:sigma-70 family RNA polymerase sigma factor [Planctomycetota bacterium]